MNALCCSPETVWVYVWCGVQLDPSVRNRDTSLIRTLKYGHLANKDTFDCPKSVRSR